MPKPATVQAFEASHDGPDESTRPLKESSPSALLVRAASVGVVKIPAPVSNALDEYAYLYTKALPATARTPTCSVKQCEPSTNATDAASRYGDANGTRPIAPDRVR